MKKACHSVIGGSAFRLRSKSFRLRQDGYGGQVGGQAGGKNSSFFILHSSFPLAFTLIELLITIVLVGIVLLALIMSFQESLKNLERQKFILSANLLSEDLMNEIRSKQYVNPQYSTNFGREAGETNRIQFDDVDDYDNWFESPPKTIEGNVITNLSGFTWRAIVKNVPATNFNSPPLPDYYTNDFKRITVVVSNTAFTVSNISVVSRDY